MTPSPLPASLAGYLLLADPTLLESTFRRTVVLITEHDRQSGAMGYILNRPSGHAAGEVIDAPEFLPVAHVPIFHGGPVEQDKLTLASLRWAAEDGLLMQCHGSADAALTATSPGDSLRAWVGYSGWGRGQLEREIKQKAWIPCRPSSGIISTPDADLWRSVLSSLGPYYRLMAEAPEKPDLN